LAGILRGQGRGRGPRLFLIAQADENSGIVVVANPRETARHGLHGRQAACAVRGDDRSDRFSHALPRSWTSLVGGAAETSFGSETGKLGFAMLGCAPETEIVPRSKQVVCHCAHPRGKLQMEKLVFIFRCLTCYIGAAESPHGGPVRGGCSFSEQNYT
jgi:hypothetical protein